ncbi:hypothetical protein N7489_000988 [Penicillium chrysogenum]|uniref:uncharacterized protein n=1 Tax=Penicillium chrysogenum TaxID=5076 RepID=UPI0024DF1ECD|nr:uncharacterized protein N7489_000988 [Penicillium chrysogenum]KAJ5250578.1 hypothetical protein N7489_000988 [Penicillium chrysogenum]KAJ6147798.1 hypothetical protein N7497_009780 [Penicillium chrysogenum]
MPDFVSFGYKNIQSLAESTRRRETVRRILTVVSDNRYKLESPGSIVALWFYVEYGHVAAACHSWRTRDHRRSIRSTLFGSGCWHVGSDVPSVDSLGHTRERDIGKGSSKSRRIERQVEQNKSEAE